MEFSFSSWSLRMRMINLDLVSMPEIGGDFFLGIISKPVIKCQKFSVSSRCARLSRRNSHSCLEIEKMTLADLWTCLSTSTRLSTFSHLQPAEEPLGPSQRTQGKVSRVEPHRRLKQGDQRGLQVSRVPPEGPPSKTTRVHRQG